MWDVDVRCRSILNTVEAMVYMVMNINNVFSLLLKVEKDIHGLTQSINPQDRSHSCKVRLARASTPSSRQKCPAPSISQPWN